MDRNMVEEINESIKRIQDGQEDSVVRLHELMGNHLRFIAIRFLKNIDDVDDLIQDFWLDIHKYCSGYWYNSNGFNYLAKTLENMAKMRLRQTNRKQKPVSLNDIIEFEDTKTDFEITIRQSCLCDTFERGIKVMSETERKVFALICYQDMTVREIATSYYDCGTHDLSYRIYSYQGVIQKHRGRQYLLTINTLSQYSNVNLMDGYSFSMMSYDYREKYYNLFTPNQNYDNSGRRYSYQEIPENANVYYTKFGYNLPTDDIDVNSLILNHIYQYTNFDFYIQYYTVLEYPGNAQQFTILQASKYIRPIIQVNYSFGVSVSSGSIGVSCGISPVEGYQESSVSTSANINP